MPRTFERLFYAVSSLLLDAIDEEEAAYWEECEDTSRCPAAFSRTWRHLDLRNRGTTTHVDPNKRKTDDAIGAEAEDPDRKPMHLSVC